MQREILLFANVLLCVVVLELTYAAPVEPMGLNAVGSLKFDCSLTQLNGTFSPKISTYNSRGFCVKFPEKTVMPWIAAGTFESNGDVQEKIDLNGVAPFNGTLKVTMRCSGAPVPLDPWLRTPEAKCDIKGDILFQGEIATLELHDFLKSRLQRDQRPFTSSFGYDRPALAAKKQADVAKFYSSPTQAGNATTPSAFPTAPTVLSPKQNGIIVKGKSEFKIVPSKYLTGTKATYQLRWVNPPANLQGKGVDFHTQSIDVSMLTSGLPVPQTLLVPGVWEFRVQIAVPKVGDWSPWVRFTYYLQQPALGTTAQDAQSQDFQFGVGGQQKTMSGNSGTRLFRPQTTPQQGLGAGPTLIRPRGVDEKGGEQHNETADTTPEMGKKP